MAEDHWDDFGVGDELNERGTVIGRRLLADRLGNLVAPPPERASEPRATEQHEHAPRDRTPKAATETHGPEVPTARPQND